MKTFNFMSTLLTLLIVCLFCSFKAAEVDFSACGTIITEGDVMRTQTTEPENEIELVILTDNNGNNYSFDGCGMNSCDFHIKSLPAGVYHSTTITAFCSFNSVVIKR